jgi:hypothetical protein
MELGSNGIQNKGSGGAPANFDVNFNGTLEGQATPVFPLDVNLTNGVSNITPTSVALTGNNLDITIVPSGVLFKTIEPSQYTSYRTGDEGWRVQNNWYDYTPPTNPKSVAELDYTSANFFYVLKNPLVVNGVSSTTRFVDVNGIQAFSATGNASAVVIDKLTGMMYLRSFVFQANWADVIDNALAYSIVVNGITYDDWFMSTIAEYVQINSSYASSALNVDSLTGVTLFTTATLTITASTNPSNTAGCLMFTDVGRTTTSFTKGSGLNGKYIRNARNLITAP